MPFKLFNKTSQLWHNLKYQDVIHLFYKNSAAVVMYKASKLQPN